MQKEISSPFGRNVTMIATGLRTALKNGATKSPALYEVTFVEPGETMVFRVSEGIVIAAGGQFTAVANAQNADVIESITKAFEMRGVLAERIDLLIRNLAPAPSGVLMDKALQAGVMSVMAMHGIGDPPKGQKQKHMVVKRGA